MTMKQSTTKLYRTHACPVRCPACRYDGKAYPARWSRAELAIDQFPAIARNSNHILFLIRGALHIRTKQNENHYLTAGQCMFFARKEIPDITVMAASEVIWLDFSNRVIFCQRDSLSTIVSTGCSCRNMIPVLPLHPHIKRLVEDLFLLESPCHHLLKQYELFMHMTNVYTREELAGFFQSILRPADDFRAFVISNYKTMGGVEDFAHHAQMSKSCFIRKFRDAFGMTIHQWTVKQKGKDMCEMIRSGKRDTKEMAQQLGMETPACLYQFCRKHFGCTMSELRTRLSDKSQADSHTEEF